MVSFGCASAGAGCGAPGQSHTKQNRGSTPSSPCCLRCSPGYTQLSVTAQCWLMSHLSPPSHFLQGCSQPIHSPSCAGAGGGPAINGAHWSQNRSVLSSFHARAMPNILTPGTDRASLCPRGWARSRGALVVLHGQSVPDTAGPCPGAAGGGQRGCCQGEPQPGGFGPHRLCDPGGRATAAPRPLWPMSPCPYRGVQRCYGARGHPSPGAAGALERQQRGAGGRALCLACLTSCPLP